MVQCMVTRDVMSAGFSNSWQEAIEQLTGAPVMSAESFIKYFLPLYEFLEQENSAAGLCIGWGGKLVTMVNWVISLLSL